MSPHPLLGPLASPSCRSLSTPASSTPTASPPSRSLPSSALPCGDYGIAVVGRLVAAVERKSLADLVSSIINGKLRYAIGDLAALPRAAVVVEDRYSQIFKLDGVRPAVVATGSPSHRSVGPASRSPSTRPTSSPRNGPTATWRRHTPGPRPNTQSLIASAFQSSPPRPQPRRRPHHRQPPRCAYGPARPAWPCRNADAAPRHLASLARRAFVKAEPTQARSRNTEIRSHY